MFKLAKPLLLAALLAASCAARADELIVSAAASLTNAFREIATNYEAQYPGAKVGLNFGASGALLQQAAKGAPVDVFASADQESMDQAEKLGLVKTGERRNFIGNSLVVVVPLKSTLSLARLPDLAQPAITRIAVGAPASVPAGRYARHALDAASLWATVEPRVISTQNVRQALDYVSRGEVDAGFVYASDAALAKDTVRLAFPVALNEPITYPIAAIATSTRGVEAKRFIAYVLSPAGQAVLFKFGFTKA